MAGLSAKDFKDLRIASTPTVPRVAGTRALPATIDDAERDFGFDIYDKMLNEPYLASAVATLAYSVLAHPLLITPGVQEPDEAATENQAKNSEQWREFGRAVELAAFMQWNLDQLGRRQVSIQQLLSDMFMATTHGNRIAEITEFSCQEGDFKGKYLLGSVRTIPHSYYRFVTDPYNNLLGVIAILPGKASALVEGLFSAEMLDNFVDREKLVVFTHKPKNGNPNGQSILRPAYDPWFRKRGQKSVELKRLAQFGGESLIIKAPEATSNEKRSWVLPDGSVKEMHISEMLLTYAQEISAGQAAVFPSGTEVDLLGAVSGADLFESHADRCNREMVMSVLLTARSTMESQRNSQADGEKAENLVDVLQGFYSKWISDAIQEQLVRPAMVRNFGDEALGELCPVVSLSKSNLGDFNRISQGVATLVNAGVITEPMKAAVCRQFLGIKYVPGQKVEAPSNQKEKDEKQAKSAADD